VAAARALINNPSIILADEPSGSLDSNNKQELHKLLCDMRDQFKQTIIIVTHDNELAQIANRIVRMQDGKIIS
jgi:lipoprotein-releasing system ATP-binding protein